MSMADLVELSRRDSVAQAELCARGEVSAAELWEGCLQRLERLNPLLRAAVTVATEPVAPVQGGPLTGVPFLVKDSTSWPGLRWSMGSRALAANLATRQTPLGRRLEAAGLVCVGKSAASELGLLASTESLLEGATHNPWDLSRSAGGSSGGSAAAVAAGLVPLAHANDGGGSLRVPASACGIFGFKPGRGRTVPAAFATSDFLAMTSDHCVSRSVRDSALFLSLTEDAEAGPPVGFVREPLRRRLRIGAWSQTLVGEAPTQAVQRAWEQAVGLLEALGHTVEVVPAPVFDRVPLSEAFFLVAGAAVSEFVDGLDRLREVPVQRGELEPFSWALQEAFAARGPDALPDARRAFAAAVQTYTETTRGFDVVLTPAVAAEPWPLGHLSPVLPRDELISRTARCNGYAPLQNLAGVPAMSVPLHLTERGLPVGTQFAAAPGGEALLLGLAYELEAAQPWHDRWPPWSIPRLAAAWRDG